MDVEWRSVVGFPDYEVSENGTVKRVKPDHWGRISGNPLKPALVNGYPMVRLSHNKKMTCLYVHSLVAKAFIGEQPTPNHEVAHRDGNRADPSLKNIRWATAKENMEDMWIHGTMRTAEKSSMSKLTTGQVLAIKRRLANFRRGILVEIAREFGVTASCISQIRQGRSWKRTVEEV